MKKKKSEEKRIPKYAYFVLKWKYKKLKLVAKEIGVSDKMLRSYVEKYWANNRRLKFERKPGAYTKFKEMLADAEESFELALFKETRKENLNFDKTLKAFKEALEKGKYEEE